MANKPGEANLFPNDPQLPSMGTFQPVYGKFDLTTYIQGASDYEIMAFLVGKYNACLEAYGTVTKLSTDTITAAHQLQDWINTWFTNLDVQQELNNKIDQMVTDGSFSTLLHQTFDAQINQQTTSTVTAWLVANVTPTGSAVVVDKSLSIEGAAADAKATGDSIGQLKEDLDILNEGGLNLKEDFIGKQVNNWLDEHPEATTTVQDHSLNVNKMVIGTLGYVTPEMFGAVGDGKTDDTESIQKALDYGNVFLGNGKQYMITSTIQMRNAGRTFAGWFGVEKNSVLPGILIASTEFEGETMIDAIKSQCTIQGVTFSGNSSLLAIRAKMPVSGSSPYASDNDIKIYGNHFVHNKGIEHHGRGLWAENNLFENPSDNAIDIYGTSDNETSIMQKMDKYGGRAVRVINNRMHAPVGSKYLVQFHNDINCRWYGVVIRDNLMDLSGSLLRSDCKLINAIISGNSVNMNYWKTPDIYLSECESVNIINNILCGREQDYEKQYLHDNSIYLNGNMVNVSISDNVIANTGNSPIYGTGDMNHCIISGNRIRRASVITSQHFIFVKGNVTQCFIDKNVIDAESKCQKIISSVHMENVWLGKNYGQLNLIPFLSTDGTYSDIEYFAKDGTFIVANS